MGGVTFSVKSSNILVSSPITQDHKLFHVKIKNKLSSSIKLDPYHTKYLKYFFNYKRQQKFYLKGDCRNLHFYVENQFENQFDNFKLQSVMSFHYWDSWDYSKPSPDSVRKWKATSLEKKRKYQG